MLTLIAIIALVAPATLVATLITAQRRDLRAIATASPVGLAHDLTTALDIAHGGRRVR
jgi:hypothetical protein